MMRLQNIGLTLIPFAILSISGLGLIWQDAGSPDKNQLDKTEKPSQKQETRKPQRVILYTGRYDRVYGVVEREAEDFIVISTDNGIDSYPKSRLQKIVRLVDPLPGQKGFVVLNDGTRHTGVMIEDSFKRVVLEINGIRTPFIRAAVDHVELFPSFEEQYETLKKTIPPTMYARRLELCRWLIDHQRYAFALAELEDLQLQKPDLPKLAQLLSLVNAQIAMMEEKDKEESIKTNDIATSETTGSSGPVDLRDMIPDEIISAEDVNMIRVYEIDFNFPPEVRISPDTIRRLITEYGSHEAIPVKSDARNAMFRWDPLKLSRLIFDIRARDLYSEIEVLTEPYALNTFRQRVHNTWLIKNCATSRCHGGVKGGRFFLHSRNYRSERVRYTNFLILERLQLSGKPPLIDYNEPALSLVIQYALPTTVARYPHPQVEGWKPILTKANAKLLDDAINWIKSMMIPRPDYPVGFDPPKLIDKEMETQNLGDSEDRIDR